MPCWDFERCNKSDDLLRPSPRKSRKIINRSQNRWRSLLSSSARSSQFPESCTNTNALLHNTPAIPHISTVSDTIERKRLLLEGYSRWNIRSSADCELTSEMKESLPQKIPIGVAKPTFCRFSDELLPIWTGFEALPADDLSGNYLCAFVLGWSYVLCASLIELRSKSEDDKMHYTNKSAALHSTGQIHSDTQYPMSIGGADSQETRWWSAVLATGCGWNATLTRDGKEFFAPWSCHLDAEKVFVLHGGSESTSSADTLDPPSSTQAYQFLLRVAELHDAFDQLLASFVATLTIQSHVRFGAPVRLPRPHPAARSNKNNTESIYRAKIPTPKKFPYFMSLSCIPDAITSSLFSCFWEQGIHCNLVSEWLYQPLEVILPTLVVENKHLTIVQILAARRPNVAPLWLGSAITGLLPQIFNICAAYLPPVSLEAATWTASPQSFIDPAFHRRPKIHRNHQFKKFISRENEFGLLYITDLRSEIYGPPPYCPYAPFGMVRLQDTALEVRLHASCGHQLAYNCWVWRGQGKEELYDHGYTHGLGDNGSDIKFSKHTKLAEWRLWKPMTFKSSKRALTKAIDEQLSASATLRLFSWTFFTDGIRLEEREKWDHEWLNHLRESMNDDQASDISHSSAGENTEAVVSWLHEVSPSPP